MCNILFSDALLECKLYEALKFIMLYQVTEVYEQMKTKKVIPSLFRLLFTRETSSDPLSFMMNHLNSVGDTCGLEQVNGAEESCLMRDSAGNASACRWLQFTVSSDKTSCKEWHACWVASVMSDSVRPHGLWPTRLLSPWTSPGKNTGEGHHCLLQGLFLDQGSNLGLLHWQAILYHWATQESCKEVVGGYYCPPVRKSDTSLPALRQLLCLRSSVASEQQCQAPVWPSRCLSGGSRLSHYRGYLAGSPAANWDNIWESMWLLSAGKQKLLKLWKSRQCFSMPIAKGLCFALLS